MPLGGWTRVWVWLYVFCLLPIYHLPCPHKFFPHHVALLCAVVCCLVVATLCELSAPYFPTYACTILYLPPSLSPIILTSPLLAPPVPGTGPQHIIIPLYASALCCRWAIAPLALPMPSAMPSHCPLPVMLPAVPFFPLYCPRHCTCIWRRRRRERKMSPFSAYHCLVSLAFFTAPYI